MMEHRAVLVQHYDVSEGGRFDLQAKALRKIAVNPVGLGSGRSQDEFGLAPHNMFLQVSAEGGWIAGIGFVGFIMLTLWHGIRLIREPGDLQKGHFVVMSCLLGTLLQSLFIDGLKQVLSLQLMSLLK